MEIEAIRAAIDGSKMLISWSLALMGGSLAIVISTGYRSPKLWYLKIPYVLIAIAWYYLFKSISLGNDIIGRGILAEYQSNNQPKLDGIFKGLNTDYFQQIHNLTSALNSLGIWLCLYLIWFIFDKNKKH